MFVCSRVNLALAYTELTEELGRVRGLAAKQSDFLRRVPADAGGSPADLVQERQGLERVASRFSILCSFLPPVSRPTPPPQHLSPTSSKRSSLSSDRLLPGASPPLSPVGGPASYSQQPSSSRLRARFQGRRSYSEVRLRRFTAKHIFVPPLTF